MNTADVRIGKVVERVNAFRETIRGTIVGIERGGRAARVLWDGAPTSFLVYTADLTDPDAVAEGPRAETVNVGDRFTADGIFRVLEIDADGVVTVETAWGLVGTLTLVRIVDGLASGTIVRIPDADGEGDESPSPAVDIHTGYRVRVIAGTGLDWFGTVVRVNTYPDGSKRFTVRADDGRLLTVAADAIVVLGGGDGVPSAPAVAIDPETGNPAWSLIDEIPPTPWTDLRKGVRVLGTTREGSVRFGTITRGCVKGDRVRVQWDGSAVQWDGRVRDRGEDAFRLEIVREDGRRPSVDGFRIGDPVWAAGSIITTADVPGTVVGFRNGRVLVADLAGSARGFARPADRIRRVPSGA